MPRVARNATLELLRWEGRATRRSPSPSGDRPLRIVAFSPTYLPLQRRGAEVSLHAVLRWLVDRGHQVQVIVDERGTWEVDGVQVSGAVSRRDARARCANADLVVGQLGGRWSALSTAARARRPSVYFVHIGNVPARAVFGSPDLTVFCSRVIRDRYPPADPHLVVHPPVDEREYLTSRTGDAITLVNLTEPKGLGVFLSLAERLPEHRFLGVRTSSEQSLPEPVPDNVTVVGPVDDMRSVYAQTRVLLLPSVYESYGRVAVEAAVSGIPTVAHPNPGTVEAMGDAAVWVDRSDLESWVREVRALDDPALHAERARRARERYEQLVTNSELDDLERSLREL